MRPADLPLKYRLALRAYPWRRCDAVAPARLARAVTQARVALVTSAGLVVPGDEPFDLDIRGGDHSFRAIAADVEVASLEVHHRSDAFDAAPLHADRNVAFPLDRLRELAAFGAVGEVAPRHLSFMGSIPAPGRLRRESAPAAAELLANDGVDIAVLVPT